MGIPEKNMKIAPKTNGGYWTVEDWRRLNLGSNDDFGNEKDWEMAIQIFEDRIKGRFIDAITILKNEDDKGKQRRFGFAIMSLICLLIETLAQFYEGIPSSQRTSNKGYKDFLSERSFHLKKFFSDDKHSNKFYDTVRCGLLHNAETRKSTLIRHKKYNDPDLPFEDIDDGLIVYWSPFYNLLEQEFDSYIGKLKEPQDDNDKTLRKNFRKKMNHICRLENEA
jgi:hypothetical protein